MCNKSRDSWKWNIYKPEFSVNFSNVCRNVWFARVTNFVSGLGTLCNYWYSLINDDDCLEILEPQTPVTLEAFPGLCMDCFTCLLESKMLWNLYIWGRKWAKWTVRKVFISMKGVPVTISFVTNWRTVYICHPKLSLRMNQPEGLR